MLRHGLAKCVLDFSKYHFLQLIDHRLDLGALQTIWVDEFDCLLNFVNTSLKNDHGLLGTLRLHFLNVMKGAEIVDVNLLILLLELGLKQSEWIERWRCSVRRRALNAHFLFNVRQLLLCFYGFFVKSDYVLRPDIRLMILLRLWNEQLVDVEFVLQLLSLQQIPIDRGLDLQSLSVNNQNVVQLATLFTGLRFLSFFFLNDRLRVIDDVHQLQVTFD